MYEHEKRLTIFTPTYNRSYVISQCYSSLLQQTNKNFIWLIVDDGSIDNTEDLVKSWIDENRVTIKYIKQKNSGKHVAHNNAVLNCQTEIFVCVDSDDYLTPDAVETIYDKWHLTKDSSIAGIIALRGVSQNKAIKSRMPKDIKRASIFELYDKLKFKGDTVIFFKTNVIKRYLFPVFDNERFVTESVVYDQISRDKDMILLDKILYICEYLEDGYTNNIDKVHKENPKGYIYYLKQRIRFSEELKDTFKWISYFIAGIWRIDLNPKLFYEGSKLLFYAAYPSACIKYIKPKIKRMIIAKR